MSDQTVVTKLEMELFSWVHLYGTMQEMKLGATQNRRIRDELMRIQLIPELSASQRDELAHDFQQMYQRSNQHMSTIFQLMSSLQSKVREHYQHFPSEN